VEWEGIDFVDKGGKDSRHISLKWIAN